MNNLVIMAKTRGCAF